MIAQALLNLRPGALLLSWQPLVVGAHRRIVRPHLAVGLADCRVVLDFMVEAGVTQPARKLERGSMGTSQILALAGVPGAR
jgi:hypothetical protein